MNAIRKTIEKYCSFALSRQKVKESIQDIFSLEEAEKKYWMEIDE